MDIVAIGHVVRRQWKVVVPTVVVGAGLTLAAASAIPDTYTATGSVIVAADPAAQALSPAIIAEAVQDASIQTRVAETASGTYTATAGDQSVIRITARSGQARSAVAVANAALDALTPTIDNRLAALGNSSLEVTVDIINRPRTAAADSEGIFTATGSAKILGVGDPVLSPNAATGLLGSTLDDLTTRADVEASGGDPAYVVTVARSTPTIGLQATGTSTEAAIANVQDLMGRASQQLATVMTAEADGGAPLVSTPYIQPTTAERDTTGVLRSVFALVAVTLAFALALAFLVEALLARRAGRPAREELDDLRGVESFTADDDTVGERTEVDKAPVSELDRVAGIVRKPTPSNRVMEVGSRSTAAGRHPSGATATAEPRRDGTRPDR